MTNLTKTVFLLSLLALYSCNSKENTPTHPLLQHNHIQDIDFEFTENEISSLQQLQKIDSCNFISFNSNHQEIVILNYCHPEKTKQRIKFPQEGPQYFGQIDGVIYVNKDSIFLSSDSELALILINDQFEVINKWPFDTNILPEELMTENATGYYSTMVGYLEDIISYPFHFNQKKQTVLFSIVCISNLPGYQELKSIYSSPSIVEIPLDSSRKREFHGEWPESYQKDQVPYNPMINFVLGKNGHIITNYHYDQNIFNLANKSFYKAQSNYATGDFSKVKTSQTEKNDDLEIKTFTLDESYVALHYDPFKQLYYRIFKQEQLNSNVPGAKPIKTEAEWSMIVLNNELKVIGEVLFEKGKYNFLNILPVEKGILIAENRNHSSTQENLVKFDLIKIIYEN